MFNKRKAEVLVVGAGPVGMLAALVLARRGIDTKIIDAASRITTDSYGCALHSGTLKLFAELGLEADLLERGRRVDKISFYDGNLRQAEVHLGKISHDFPFLLVLPQSSVEDLLERELAKHQIDIDWKHRLTSLEQQPDTVIASVDKIGAIGRGYIVAEVDEAVVKNFSYATQFVIGADGCNSHVRDCLDIRLLPSGRKRKFAMCEFQTDTPLEGEARIVLQEDRENALWPASEGRCRWTFELPPETAEEVHEKARDIAVAESPEVEREERELVKRSLARQAAWFHGTVGEIQWFDEAEFDPGLAERFGEGRCWLAGEAAHQSDPIGAQSLNVGLREAVDLATRIANILGGDSLDSLSRYDRERQEEWKRLQGERQPISTRETGQWMREHREQILSCLPVSGEQLTPALHEVGLSL